MRTLLIDNYDSFTYNLSQLAYRVYGQQPVVVTNDARWEEINLADFDAIIVSPGPGHPGRACDVGISAAAFAQDQLPVLGVCLGHQLLAEGCGGMVAEAPEPVHGRLAQINHCASGLFAGIPQGFSVVRYHSLSVHQVPEELEVTAWTADGLVMGLGHRHRPFYSVQFHPESILSEYGAEILANFARCAAPHQAGHYYRLHTRCFPLELPAAAIHARYYAHQEHSFWLDSANQSSSGHADQPAGVFSILGDDAGPLAERAHYTMGLPAPAERDAANQPSSAAGSWQITTTGGRHQVAANFYDYLSQQLRQRRIIAGLNPDLPFCPGYIAVCSYQLKDDAASLVAATAPVHRSRHPEALLFFADRVVVVNERDHQVWVMALSRIGDEASAAAAEEFCQQRHKELVELAGNPPVTQEISAAAIWGEQQPVFRLADDRQSYLAKIQQCLAEIRQGESYEICLTTTAIAPPLADSVAAYTSLRTQSPAPYGALIRTTVAQQPAAADGAPTQPGRYTGRVEILAASPERFLKINPAGQVETKPIKGTRARSADPAADAAAKADLSQREKDRAENLMIVDLLRNDLNRVCAPDTVAVPHLFAVESFSHVHQLVSTITGQLAAGKGPIDCLQATFPGGSMTGAPKKRTLEIIDRLEESARGYYSGTLGWIGLNGASEFSIIIRTVIADEEQTSLGVGGAIVAQSDPAEEWAEIHTKASGALAGLKAQIYPPQH